MTIWGLLAPFAVLLFGPPTPPDYPVTLPAVVRTIEHQAPAQVYFYRTAPATWDN